MKIQQTIIAIAALILSLSVAYYLLVYTPSQRNETIQRQNTNELTEAKNYCMREYDKKIEELNKMALSIYGKCHITGVCNKEQLEAHFKSKDPNYISPYSLEWRNNFLDGCVSKYRPL